MQLEREPDDAAGDVGQLRLVPGELCAVVRLPAGGPARRAAVYEQVRQLLDRRLAELHDPAARAILPLRRDQAKRRPEPALYFERRDGSAVALLFYTAQLVDSPDHLPTTRADATQRLIDGLNTLVPQQPTHDEGWSVGAVSPNWLSLGAPDWGGSGVGGPGSAPQAVPPAALRGGAQQFGFDFHPPLPPVKARSDGVRLIVAVLDTCPGRASVEAAAARCAASGAPNPRLEQMAADDPVWSTCDLVLGDAADFRHLQAILPNWRGGLQGWAPRMKDASRASARSARYDIADHGLFVAGIIREIVGTGPDRPLHLIRVLDDAGVGDLLGIATALRALPDTVLRDAPPGTRLIVNLSLMVEAPSAELGPALDALDADEADLFLALGPAHGPLGGVVQWLTQEWGALVVAAAGNDALAFSRADRPEARAPACYDAALPGLLGVAAVAAPGTPPDPAQGGDALAAARYSNRSRKGVAVWGGNAADRAAAGEPPRVGHLPDGRPDGVVGLFSRPIFPFGGGDNTTGWAYWSGTSFATPIVSGAAARLWLADPSLDAAAVADGVRARATAAEEVELECRALRVRQRP